MKRTRLRTVILLAVLSIAGILAIQIVWVTKTYNQQEKEFNDRVHIALTQVNKKIQTLRKDSSYIYNPIEQISSSSFIVKMNDTLHPYILETLLEQEFTDNNLSKEFEYGIYDCFTDSIVFGGKVSLNEVEDQPENVPNIQAIKWERDGHYFGVYFPNKVGDVISNMKIWLFLSIILLLVVLFFAYALSVILKQKKLSEIKTDFINNMTHELKTPISTIALSSSVLMSDNIVNEPERLHRYAQIIQNENLRLKNQVDKVLQIATLDKDTIELTEEHLNVHNIIKNAINTLDLNLQDKNGEVTLSLEAKRHNIFADKVHITNVIYNLIDNAIKYSEAPRIEISTREESTNLIINVKDNGLGIEKQNIGSIFEKFYRVPTGNVHNVKGFGLGLYYVKKMVEAHKGEITIESKIGIGSNFQISLPLAKQ
ncbi:MAG: two-component system phosphate regulon sensor histidine kinase PhoR [Patiriisocius sp.]